jgi:hypothetical protein
VEGTFCRLMAVGPFELTLDFLAAAPPADRVRANPEPQKVHVAPAAYNVGDMYVHRPKAASAIVSGTQG